jgi:subtilisin family serine protease
MLSASPPSTAATTWPGSQTLEQKQSTSLRPGKDILSTWLNDDYREASGTSMATPYVSGVAALVVANQPNISMGDLKARLLKSVDKLDSLKGKIVTGGRVNAAKALGN